MGKLFFGLIGFFFLEIWVLIKVGSVIGGLATLILMVISTLLGVQLVRTQGIATLLGLQGQLMRREAVGRELFDGVWLAVAGFFFIFPGFVSDLLALLLLQPFCRRQLTRLLLAVAGWRISVASTQTPPEQNVYRDLGHDGQDAQASSAERKGTTIEGEFERKE